MVSREKQVLFVSNGPVFTCTVVIKYSDNAFAAYLNHIFAPTILLFYGHLTARSTNR